MWRENLSLLPSLPPSHFLTPLHTSSSSPTDFLPCSPYFFSLFSFTLLGIIIILSDTLLFSPILFRVFLFFLLLLRISFVTLFLFLTLPYSFFSLLPTPRFSILLLSLSYLKPFSSHEYILCLFSIPFLIVSLPLQFSITNSATPNSQTRTQTWIIDRWMLH